VRRLHLPPEQLAAAKGGPVPLTAAQAHYLSKVLRLRPGDPVEVFDGLGSSWPAGVAAGPAAGEAALLLGERRAGRSGPLDIWLAQALAKGDKLELVLQKATELGASRVLPFAAARSVVRLDEERGQGKAERWRRIAQEAARQCGRADVPQVDAPLRFPELLELASADPERRGLLLDPAEEAVRLSAAARGAGRLLLVIGPEGGLSPEEVSAARSAGLVSVSLGPLVLRTETAGLAALSVLQHLAGALG
jgi:16S rRNA (uracil1498-N3)-methyltransferase